ncbi:MAG: ABC transporter permease [Clostridia bacterium]|nr:ABC transporter permease [Clostridia bacterium]
MKKAFSVFIITVALIFIYAPIILLLIFSFTSSRTMGVWSGFSFELYQNLVSKEQIRKIIIDTLILALLSATVSTVLGTVGAIGIFYNKKWLGKFTKTSSQIPVINAEIVTAISLALVFAVVSLGKSYVALLIGHIVLLTPFVVLSVLPRLKQMDGSTYEASLDLGATPTQALFKVVLPQIFPGIVSGFLLAITLSLDDYMITTYLRPTGFETISTYVFKALSKPRNSFLPEMRALSSVLFVIMVVVAVVLSFKKTKEKNR